MSVKKILVIVFFVFVLAVTFLVFRSNIKLPFSLDETEEASIGWKLNTMGPKTFQDVPGGNIPISHPLLYSFTQSLVQRFFGPQEMPLRIYGIFQFLLSLLVSMLIIAEITRENLLLRASAMGIGIVLYLLSPLLLQHAIVINADNNILTTLILVFLYFFIRYERLSGRRFLWSRLKLSLLFALCLWVKEMSPVFLFIGILGYRILCVDMKKMLLDLFLVGVMGITIFWLTWWLYCSISHIDALGFIKFTLINKSKKAFSQTYLKDSAWEVFRTGLRWHIYWVSAPFFIALFIFCVERVKNLIKARKPDHLDLLFAAALGIWVPFQFFKASIDMMKYQYPSYVVFIILISWLFANMLVRKEEKTGQSMFGAKNLTILLVSFSGFAFYYFRIGDYLLAIWRPMHQHMNGHFLYYYYIPIVLALVIVFIVSRKKVLWENITLALVLLIIPINVALGLNQAKAKYTTAEIWLNYGEVGLRDCIEYLSQRLKGTSITAVRFDIEYYLRERYHLNIYNITTDKLFLATDPRVLFFLFSQVPFDVVVLDPISGVMQLNKEIFMLVDKFFVLEKRIGNFLVYRRR